MNNWYVYYEGNKDYKGSSLRLILGNIFVLVTLVAALSYHASVVVLIGLFFLTNSIINLFFYYFGERTAQKQISTSLTPLSVGFALRCTFQKITATVGENLQSILIGNLFGFANLALFQIALAIMNTFSGLMGAFASTYAPLLIKYKKIAHGRVLFLHIVLGLTLWGSSLLLIKFFFTPIYGPAYAQSILIAYLISGMILLLPVRHYITSYYTFDDKNGLIIAVNTVATFGSIATLLMLKNSGFVLSSVCATYVNFMASTIPLILIFLLRRTAVSVCTTNFLSKFPRG